MDFIDEDIRSLISKFLEKGYLPYTSCAGHSEISKRFISLATHSKESAEQIKKLLPSVRRVVIKKLGENSTLEFIKNHRDEVIALREIEAPIRNQVRHLNRVYNRGYDEYWIVDIIIEEGNKEAIKLATDKIFEEVDKLPFYDM